MNILYLAHRIPYPPNKGDKLRAFRHLEHLSRSHSVWCACFVDSATDVEHVKSLRAICKDVIAIRLRPPLALARGALGLLGGSTVTESYYRHPAMFQALQRLSTTRRFDVAMAFSSSMAPYALRFPARRRILDLCDCDSRKWLAYADQSLGPMSRMYRAEGLRLQTCERRWARSFDATLLITESEAQPLRPYVATDRLYIVGNGVIDSQQENEHPRGLKPAARHVGFVGVMNYRPNVEAVCWFAETCWSDVRQAIPRAEFRIAGRSPNRRVRRLARIPGVRVVGEVDDVRAELDRLAVSIAPMRIACGLPNKVLEAMSAGLPVIVSGNAANAVDASDGVNCIVADTPDRFIRAVVRLLRNPHEALRIGRNGRDFVLRHYRWEDQLRRLEWIVTGAVAKEANASDIAGAAKRAAPRFPLLAVTPPV